jgi:hypothetical protein
MTTLSQLIETNSQCADCSAEPVQFVSKRFGVMLCSLCAQYHQDLGLAPKSFDEPFRPEELAFIASRGNEVVNSVLCKAVPPWYVQPKDFQLR